MPHMTPLMIEYLLAASDTVGEDIEYQVDTVVLRAKTGYSRAEDRDAPSIPFAIGLPSMPSEPAPKRMLPAASPPLGR
jgi:hypothetical protein